MVLTKKVAASGSRMGFVLPESICEEFEKRHGFEIGPYVFHTDEIRGDERLIEILESHANVMKRTPIYFKEIPKDCIWKITEQDGIETVNWYLPKDMIIDQMGMIMAGEMKEEEAHDFTKGVIHYIKSGKTMAQFETQFRAEVTLLLGE